jgi:hypothetical protein
LNYDILLLNSHINEQVGLLKTHQEGARFGWDTTYPEAFHSFLQLFQGKFWDSTSIRPQRLPSDLFNFNTLHHSSHSMLQSWNWWCQNYQVKEDTCIFILRKFVIISPYVNIFQ